MPCGGIYPIAPVEKVRDGHQAILFSLFGALPHRTDAGAF